MTSVSNNDYSRELPITRDDYKFMIAASKPTPDSISSHFSRMYLHRGFAWTNNGIAMHVMRKPDFDYVWIQRCRAQVRLFSARTLLGIGNEPLKTIIDDKQTTVIAPDGVQSTMTSHGSEHVDFWIEHVDLIRGCYNTIPICEFSNPSLPRWFSRKDKFHRTNLLWYPGHLTIVSANPTTPQGKLEIDTQNHSTQTPFSCQVYSEYLWRGLHHLGETVSVSFHKNTYTTALVLKSDQRMVVIALQGVR